jgi:hypothetical protein
MRCLPLAALLALVIGCGKKSDPRPIDDPPPAGDPTADKTEAAKRLKEIGVAMHVHNDVRGFLPAGFVTKGGVVGLSWRVQLLPYIDQEALYKQFKLDEPWDSDHNKPLAEKMPAVYSSPGKAAPAGQTYLRSFAGMYGVIRTPPPGAKANFPPPAARGTDAPGRRLQSISDGTSGTFLVAEAAEPVVWTKPEELSAQPPEKGPMGPDAVVVPKLGGPFAGGFHALMCDGQVFFFRDTVSAASLRALITPDGGEVLMPDAADVVYPPKPKAAAPPSVAPDAPRQAAVANLQKIVRAAHEYHDEMGSLPAGFVAPKGQLGLSWRVALLPALGEKELFAQFKLNEAWDSEHNKKLLPKMPAVFASTGKPAPAGTTFLQMTTGAGGFLNYPPQRDAEAGKPHRGRRVSDIQDGTSNTAMVVEAADAIPWTRPDALGMEASYSEKAGTPVPKLGGAFDGGFHAGMADGVVMFVKTTLPKRELFALLTPAGGELSDFGGHVAYAVAGPPLAPKPQGKTLTKP